MTTALGTSTRQERRADLRRLHTPAGAALITRTPVTRTPVTRALGARPPGMRPSAMRACWALACCALLLASGCRRAPEPPPEATQRTVPTEQAPPAATASPEPNAITPDRPDELLAFIPPNPALLLLIDADATRIAWVNMLADTDAEAGQLLARVGMALDRYGESGDVVQLLGRALRLSRLNEAAFAHWPDGSWLLVTQPAVAENAPDEEAAPVPAGPEGINLAVRDGWLLVGSGAAFDAAVSRDHEAHDPARSWAAGWEPLPDDALFTVVVDDLSAVPERWQERLVALNDTDARRASLAVRADGVSVMAVQTDDDTPLRRMMGQAHAASFERLDGYAEAIPPMLGSWTNYINLVAQASWSRLRVTRDDDTTRLELLPGVCGRPIRNLMLGAALTGSVLRARHQLDPEAPVFENVEQRLAASCDSIPGPAPALPRRFARLVGESGVVSALVLADHGALLRANLPTAFQLLPFALHPDDVIEALGSSALGVSQIRSSAEVAMVFEAGPSSDGVDFLISVPAGAEHVLPQRLRAEGSVVEGEGFVVASASVLARMALADANAGMASIVAELPTGTAASITLSRLALLGLLQELDRAGPWSDLLRRARHVTAGIDDQLNLRLYIEVSGEAAQLAEALTRNMREVVVDAVRSEGPRIESVAGSIFLARIAEVLATELRATAPSERLVVVDLGSFGRAGALLVIGGALYAGLTADRIALEGGLRQLEMVPTRRSVEVQRQGEPEPR